MKQVLDPRLNAYRIDLADEKLRNQVASENYTSSRPAHVISHFADILKEPDHDSGLQTQILSGHDLEVFENRNGWSWIQRQVDGYVGYVASDQLTDGTFPATHMILNPRTFLYPEPDLKSPRCGYLSMGSRVWVTGSTETRGTRYAELKNGSYVVEKHLIAIGEWRDDPVAVAETLLHAPYLWGGDSGFGIDCSGLVFLSNMLCGIKVLRDSDMQALTIGVELETDYKSLRRGDLVFWKGHVGMMADHEFLLHANGNTMNVAIERLDEAIERIGYLYGQPTAVRRPQ